MAEVDILDVKALKPRQVLLLPIVANGGNGGVVANVENKLQRKVNDVIMTRNSWPSATSCEASGGPPTLALLNFIGFLTCKIYFFCSGFGAQNNI